METATFAGGCFWCTEAIFKRIRGVEEVISGYSGGNPPTSGGKIDYETVSGGSTGHAETIRIEFDPKTISYEKLVEIFFHLHDPTTLNRQGSDVGGQYRSMIFYHNQVQKEIAEKVRSKIEKEGIYKNPIVTEILPFDKFYKAENYHQNFYDKNPEYAYCKIVIDPKIQKLLREFEQEVK